MGPGVRKTMPGVRMTIRDVRVTMAVVRRRNQVVLRNKLPRARNSNTSITLTTVLKNLVEKDQMCLGMGQQENPQGTHRMVAGTRPREKQQTKAKQAQSDVHQKHSL